MRRVRHVQEDAARLIILLPDHDDLFGSLDEIDGLHALEQEARNAHRPAAGLPAETGSSRKNAFVALAEFLARPGLKDRIADIGNRKCRLGTLDSPAWRIVRQKIDHLRLGR